MLLKFGDVSWNGSAGDLLIVPDGLHSLEAVEDSAILLTVTLAVTSSDPAGQAP